MHEDKQNDKAELSGDFKAQLIQNLKDK
jgi:hypothetical protein